jgi:hypothetical protein
VSSSDDLPPLPDTMDPFALLGVAHDADERTIKKAYARLIKVYRPDRAPEQFQRVHRAFELARELSAAGIASAAASGRFAAASAEPAASVEPAPPRDDHRAVVAELRAAEGGDAERVLARALDAGAPLDELFGDIALDVRDRLLASNELTWPRLRTHLAFDPEVVSAVLLARFETLVAQGRYAQVAAELRDKQFREDGEDDAAVAVPALRAIAALAWRWNEAHTLLESWCTVPRELGVEALIDRVDGELVLASRWRASFGASALRNAPLRPVHADDFPDALISLIADAALSSPRRRGALLQELDRLLSRPDRVLAFCDRIATLAPELAHDLIHRFQGEVPRAPRRLDALSRSVFEELGLAIVELESTLHAPVRPWMIAAGGVAGVAVAVTAVIPVAIGAGVALGSAGLGGLRLGLARRRYLQKVRPGLAAILCKVGVQANALRQWLSINPRLAGDLATYDIAVANDLSLALLASLAAVVRETQRRPDMPDTSEVDEEDLEDDEPDDDDSDSDAD